MELHSGEELRDDDDFGQPIWIKHSEGLGISLPNLSAINGQNLLRAVHSSHPTVDVIDVSAQKTIEMPTEQFLRHFEEAEDGSPPLNCLGLEVSGSFIV